MSASERSAWQAVSLSEIGKVVRGGSPRPAGDPRYFNGEHIPWLTVAALTNLPDSTLVVAETASCLTEFGAQFSRTLDPGTLIIANSGATLGVAKLLGVRCCANDGIAALLNVRRDVDPAFVAHQINSQTEILRNVVATGNGQPNLNTGLIGAIRIPLPDHREQVAVAQALEDANALIDSLEQLLTKQRQMKQGAMQELLTGKRRLPGFGGVWNEVTLGSFGKTYGGLTGKGKADFGHGAAQYVTFMNVMSNLVIEPGQHEPVDVGPAESQNVVRAGDWLFNGSSETPEEVALCSVVGEAHDALYLNSFCFGFRPHDPKAACAPFMAYFFRGRPGRQSISALAQGATRYNLSKTALLRTPLLVPPVAEQHAIAQVLTDMDTSLTALQARLTKARQLKQALMQVLLTGRIRLLPPGAAATGASPA